MALSEPRAVITAVSCAVLSHLATGLPGPSGGPSPAGVQAVVLRMQRQRGRVTVHWLLGQRGSIWRTSDAQLSSGAALSWRMGLTCPAPNTHHCFFLS